MVLAVALLTGATRVYLCKYLHEHRLRQHYADTALHVGESHLHVNQHHCLLKADKLHEGRVVLHTAELKFKLYVVLPRNTHHADKVLHQHLKELQVQLSVGVVVRQAVYVAVSACHTVHHAHHNGG